MAETLFAISYKVVFLIDEEVGDGGHNFATEQSRRELYDLIIGFLP